MNPFKDTKEAAQYVEKFEGKASDLKLAICDSLQDSIGINMAIITDIILGKGWEPNGYEEKEGYRVYMYKEME
jgi:hypothetical protein